MYICTAFSKNVVGGKTITFKPRKTARSFGIFIMTGFQFTLMKMVSGYEVIKKRALYTSLRTM